MALTALTVFCLAALVTWLGKERSGVHFGTEESGAGAIAPPEASARRCRPACPQSQTRSACSRAILLG
jgi:hypothetical protein